MHLRSKPSPADTKLPTDMLHQYSTVEDLENQESDIKDILNKSYACLTAGLSTKTHSSLPELKWRAERLMAVHSNSITNLSSELGVEHPMVITHTLEHDSLEDRVINLAAMVKIGYLHKDIGVILTNMEVCITARTINHSILHELREQVIDLMSDYTYGITMVTDKLGQEHPMLSQSMLEHVSLENTVNNMLRLVQHVVNLQEERSKEQAQASPLLRVLKELRSRVYRTINVIYSSIEHRKTDIQVYLPKLDDEVCNMLGEHY